MNYFEWKTVDWYSNQPIRTYLHMEDERLVRVESVMTATQYYQNRDPEDVLSWSPMTTVMGCGERDDGTYVREATLKRAYEIFVTRAQENPALDV